MPGGSGSAKSSISLLVGPHRIVEVLAADRAWSHDPDRRLPPASVFKVPIMVELLRQVEAGRHRLDDEHRIHEGLCRHGSGIDDTSVGSVWSLRDLCDIMIAHSDNVATDLVLEVIGLESVNRTMDALGFADTRVDMPIGRWHYRVMGLGDAPITAQNTAAGEARIRLEPIDIDGPAYRDRDNNLTSAQDMADLLERMHGGRLLSASASALMLDMLHRCADRSMLARHVDPGIVVAHKYGASKYIRADVGILEFPGRPVVVAALTLAQEKDGQRPGRELIARVGKVVTAALYPEALVG